MLRLVIRSLVVLLFARPLAAQVLYSGAASAGGAFMLDLDDPDPAGSFSVTAALERREVTRSISFGVEAGLHRYLRLRQLLEDGTSVNRLEDRRKAWRITPYARWRTRGALVRVSGMVGTGLYVFETSYFQKGYEAGELVLDEGHEFTAARPGLNLGIGLELLSEGGWIGMGAGLRAHTAVGSRSDGFYTAELGLVLSTSRRPASARSRSPADRRGAQPVRRKKRARIFLAVGVSRVRRHASAALRKTSACVG